MLSKLGVFATLVRKNCGYEGNKRQVADMPIGTKYEVESIYIGSGSTSIYLTENKESFNAIHFDFSDDAGNPVDIFADARFNPYIQYKMA